MFIQRENPMLRRPIIKDGGIVVHHDVDAWASKVRESIAKSQGAPLPTVDGLRVRIVDAAAAMASNPARLAGQIVCFPNDLAEPVTVGGISYEREPDAMPTVHPSLAERAALLEVAGYDDDGQGEAPGDIVESAIAMVAGYDRHKPQARADLDARADQAFAESKIDMLRDYGVPVARILEIAPTARFPRRTALRPLTAYERVLAERAAAEQATPVVPVAPPVRMNAKSLGALGLAGFTFGAAPNQEYPGLLLRTGCPSWPHGGERTFAWKSVDGAGLDPDMMWSGARVADPALVLHVPADEIEAVAYPRSELFGVVAGLRAERHPNVDVRGDQWSQADAAAAEKLIAAWLPMIVGVSEAMRSYAVSPYGWTLEHLMACVVRGCLLRPDHAARLVLDALMAESAKRAGFVRKPKARRAITINDPVDPAAVYHPIPASKIGFDEVPVDVAYRWFAHDYLREVAAKASSASVARVQVGCFLSSDSKRKGKK